MKQNASHVKGILIGTAAALAGLSACSIFIAKRHPYPPVPKADPQKIRIACIGDSITYGSGIKFQGRARNVWIALLEQKLPSKYQVLNYGISGATLQQEGDFPYRHAPHLAAAKEAKASLYLIMLGSNDSKPYNWDPDRYSAQLMTLVNELQEGSWPHKVILLTPPYACPRKGKDVVAYDISNEVIRDEIRPIILKTAQAAGIDVIDLYAYTLGCSTWMADGVHPNKEGNQKIAEKVYRDLQSMNLRGE